MKGAVYVVETPHLEIIVGDLDPKWTQIQDFICIISLAASHKPLSYKQMICIFNFTRYCKNM